MFHVLTVLLAAWNCLVAAGLYVYFRRRHPEALDQAGWSRYGLFVGAAIASVSTGVLLWLTHSGRYFELVYFGIGGSTLFDVSLFGLFAGLAVLLGAATRITVRARRE